MTSKNALSQLRYVLDQTYNTDSIIAKEKVSSILEQLDAELDTLNAFRKLYLDHQLVLKYTGEKGYTAFIKKIVEAKKQLAKEQEEQEIKSAEKDKEIAELNEKILSLESQLKLYKLLNEFKTTPKISPSTTTNPCENCTFYRDTISKGKIYVGDSPCDWCSNRQPTCNW